MARYNVVMGGVVKMDNLVAVHTKRIRQHKLNWAIFAYSLNISFSSAWLLMKKLFINDRNYSNLHRF